MGHDMLCEITRRSIPLTKNDGLYLSWRDSVVNVRTDKGMNFFKFAYDLECLDKDLNLLESSIPSPKDSPATALCKSKFISSEMKNYDYTEMIIDSSFWPHNQALNQEMTNIRMSAWSPRYFFEHKSVLALLNSAGNVSIVAEQQYRWKTILDLSLCVLDVSKYNKSPKTFEELKTSVFIVETSSICWAPELNPKQSCYFVTAQKDGAILIWEIFDNMNAPALKGKIQTDISEIKNMLWIAKVGANFLLICSNILGQVYVFDITLENNDAVLNHSHALWQCQDRMIAVNLQYILIDEKITVFYSKHRHFVVQMLDTHSRVQSLHTSNVNDYRITDIVSSLDGFYLATINVKIYKLDFNVVNDTISVQLIPVELKEQFPTYELYSLSFSNMNTVCALGMVDRKLLYRKEVYKIEIIFVSTESKLNLIIPTLLNNPSKKLMNYWDCIECLRYKINKTKAMPELDYNSLFFEPSKNQYSLKIYLVLLIFYLNMRKLARISPDFMLPELSVEVVKEKILLTHAQTTVDTLYGRFKSDGKLNILQQETLFGSLKYLEYHSKKHKIEIAVDPSALEFIRSNFIYVCQSCDEVIEGFTCKNNHINMFCMLTFALINSDNYLICKCCGATARSDLFMGCHPLCVFCDQCLIYPD